MEGAVTTLPDHELDRRCHPDNLCLPKTCLRQYFPQFSLVHGCYLRTVRGLHDHDPKKATTWYEAALSFLQETDKISEFFDSCTRADVAELVDALP